MKTSRNWPITPNTSIGLLILIAVLHLLENLVKSTVRIAKILAIAILILLRIKASRSGAAYLYKGYKLLFAANHPHPHPTTTAGGKADQQTSLELSLWLALAKRARDMAACAFSRFLESSKMDFVGVDAEGPSQEGSQPATVHGSQTEEKREQ